MRSNVQPFNVLTFNVLMKLTGLGALTAGDGFRGQALVLDDGAEPLVKTGTASRP
jgi:hypothetical protein